jgi:hypothetical protein
MYFDKCSFDLAIVYNYQLYTFFINMVNFKPREHVTCFNTKI